MNDRTGRIELDDHSVEVDKAELARLHLCVATLKHAGLCLLACMDKPGPDQGVGQLESRVAMLRKACREASVIGPQDSPHKPTSGPARTADQLALAQVMAAVQQVYQLDTPPVHKLECSSPWDRALDILEVPDPGAEKQGELKKMLDRVLRATGPGLVGRYTVRPVIETPTPTCQHSR